MFLNENDYISKEKNKNQLSDSDLNRNVAKPII